jgi:ABC-type uncharacterized transport system substrate-binding protein
MRRRHFIGGVAAMAAARPTAVRAQQVRRVGVLLMGSAPARDLELAQALERLGYVEGRNIAITVRGADADIGRLPALARELVASRPDVLVGATSNVAMALSAVTRDIPIVMSIVGDPVALGLTTSMSRPSRNVTGFTISTPAIAAKRLEMMRTLLPEARKLGYVWVPGNPIVAIFHEQVRAASDRFGIELVSLPVSTEGDVATALDRATQERVTAVIIEADTLTIRLTVAIGDECLIRNLPAMHPFPYQVRDGALIAYGPAGAAGNVKGTAEYVDRLLKGARIADLPFQEPAELKLAINLRTARSLDLTVPPDLLVRADEVIE